MRFIFSVALLLVIADALYAQRYEPVQRTPQHELIRKMAAEVVTRGHVPSTSHKPSFYICDKDHLHWCLGYVDVDTDSLPMAERLQIEWFNKYLDDEDRRYWNPYFREVDSLIGQFMRESAQDDDEALRQRADQYRDAIREVYVKGVKAYANAKGVELSADNCSRLCCAAPSADVLLTSNLRNVTAIKWIAAGTVWLQVSRTGTEPEYHTYAPGSTVTMTPGAMYYYKLVTSDGRETKRLLAPEIPSRGDKLVLVWQ